MSELRARRASILVADRDPKALAALELSLRALDADVTTASSAEQALSAIVRRGIDLVLLDVQMLGESALTVLVGRRDGHRVSGMVLLGAFGSPAAGISPENFFAAPVDHARLLERVAMVIGRAGGCAGP